MAEGWALVVGGSGALGAACARELARERPVVVTWARWEDAAQAVVREIELAGGQASSRQLKLPDGDPGDLVGMHSLVFAAGADIDQPYISEMSPDQMRSAIEIELHGFLAIAQAALPQLRRNKGNIVTLLSAGLGRWPPGDALSVVPKAGVQALIRGLAREEGRNGVRANAVAIGVVEAGLFERIDFSEEWLAAARRNIALRRFAKADEVANAVAFLASDRATYITGQTLFVDGGYAL